MRFSLLLLPLALTASATIAKPTVVHPISANRPVELIQEFNFKKPGPKLLVAFSPT